MLRISQSQIVSYNKCNRYYYLKNIEHKKWPSSYKSSAALSLGTLFHGVIHRHIMGIPDNILLEFCGDDKVRGWFETFLEADPLRDYEFLYPEQEVSAIFYDILWEGKYDVLALKNEKITIFDWKTTKKEGKLQDYILTPQTKLYRLLAITAAQQITKRKNIEATDVEMIYWFPEHPDKPIVIPYTTVEYEQDLTWLKTQSALLRSENIEDYKKTSDIEKCVSCPYCTYCHPNANIQEIEDNDYESECDMYTKNNLDITTFLDLEENTF